MFITRRLLTKSSNSVLVRQKLVTNPTSLIQQQKNLTTKVATNVKSTTFFTPARSTTFLRTQIATCMVLTTFGGVAYCDGKKTVETESIEKVKPQAEKEVVASELLVIDEAATAKSYLLQLWDSIYDYCKTTYDTGSDCLRYMQRIFMYCLYGSPLLVLLPSNYLLMNVYPEFEQYTWSYLLFAIQSLGPCFIKLAQWASSRPDIFPPTLIERLEMLQDEVPVNYGPEVINNTLNQAFGSHWKDHLVLDPKPLGAGSVAQVFRGELTLDQEHSYHSSMRTLTTQKDGDSTTSSDGSNAVKSVFKKAKGLLFLKQQKEEEVTGDSHGRKKKIAVAVKVIHPHVESLIRTDMELLSYFADFMDMFPSLEMLSIGETCRQFSDSMNQQLDLRLEASHLFKFGKKFAHESWAAFPLPIEGYISKNVLVETLMEGIPIKYFMQMKDDVNNKTRDLKMKLSDLGCRLILKMIFFDNYIHGDLHPGNMWVQMLPNGNPRLIILDCGIVYSSRSEDEHRKLVDICLAFMQHDGIKAGHLMIEKADLESENNKIFDAKNNTAIKKRRRAVRIENEEQFCHSIQALVTKSESQNVFEHLGEYLGQICELARVHMVRLDPGYFKIAMSLKVLEGVSLALHKELDLISKCLPIVMKARAMQAMGIKKFPTPEDDEEFLKTHSK